MVSLANWPSVMCLCRLYFFLRYPTLCHINGVESNLFASDIGIRLCPLILRGLVVCL